MTPETKPIKNNDEEKKIDNSEECLGNPSTAVTKSIVATTSISPSLSTDIVLDSMDDCMGCINSIKEQHNFEETLGKQTINQRDHATEQGLNDSIDTSPIAVDLCNGIIAPMDTTLPTSIPGNHFLESKLGMIARSLIDVAAETEALQETLEEEVQNDVAVQ